MHFLNVCLRVIPCGKSCARYWTVFLCFSFAFFLFSQNYPVRNYTVEDGLASSTINGITQDHSGLMWFATAAGISSYDGITWTNYTRQDGLPFDQYFHIKVDKNNTVWACTEDLNDGLIFFNRPTRRWSHILGPGKSKAPAIPILAIALLDSPSASHPQIGIGTRERGFYLYSGSGWVLPADTAKHNQTTIHGVDAQNNLFYLGTPTGVYTLDPTHPQQWTIMPIPTPSPSIRALALEKSPASHPPDAPLPRMWLCGENWAGTYYKNHFSLLYRGTFPFYLHRLTNRHIFILPDSYGGLWVANTHFLFNIDSKGRTKQIRIQNPSVTDGAYALFYDREANLWTANFRGACKISNFCFVNYNQKDGLFDNEVSAMVEYRPGFFAFGHNGGFSFLNDYGIETYEILGTHKKYSQSVRVLDMCLDNHGNIWAAVNLNGIVRITPSISSQTNAKTQTKLSLKLQMRWYTHFNLEKFSIECTSIACDPRGNIVALNRDNLYQWDPYRDRFIQLKTTGEVIDQSRRLLIEKDGTRYIATLRQGLLRVSGPDNRITRFTSPEYKLGNSVYAVYAHKTGDVLVGTAAGLFYLAGDRLRRCSNPYPLIDFPVYFILPDHDGNLWFGLSNGLIRWDGTHSRHYTMSDGLSGREANRAANLVDSRGRVWVGLDLGVSCYYKEQEPYTRTAPLTQWLYLDASGTRYALDQENTLPANENDLTFYFKGISFINEPSITYRLKLEGFDTKWSSQSQSAGNQVRYTNVAPGKYRFHLRALNTDGVASPILSSGTITVKKPFSQTLWFYLVISGALSTLFLSIHYAISRKRRAVQLENQVRLRTRQLEESEEELRNIFNNVHDAIFIFDPHTEIIFEANQRACDIYGFSKAEFIGMSLKSISLDVKAGENQVSETLELGIYQNFESIQFRKDRSKMFLEINASVITYRGQKAILSVNRDVTGRKLANLKIQDSLREKESLLKEIHHRVKNNLQIISSLLDLQSDTLEDAKINRVFMDSKNRIASMALLHENLYQSEDLARINIGDYIQDIFDHFLSIFGEVVVRVTPTIQIAPIFLGMDASLPLGLIITELISNALKYAFPGQRTGTISITLNLQDANKLILIFSDNGIGIPPELDLATCNSLGIQLVTILTRQLKGNLELDRTNGTTFKITFPYTLDIIPLDIEINPKGDIHDKNKNNDR